MSEIRSVCVYCGSRLGTRQDNPALAADFGRALARRGIRLIYGGGRVGLMGVLADAVLAGGGAVTGIIPQHLLGREVGHESLSDLIVVDSMHARKHRMFSLADGFVALPGGLGTFDETIEILTWRQLRLHDKPLVLLDHCGYWQPFLDLLRHAVAAGFADPSALSLFQVAEDVEGTLAALSRAARPSVPDRPERL